VENTKPCGGTEAVENRMVPRERQLMVDVSC